MRQNPKSTSPKYPSYPVNPEYPENPSYPLTL